MLFGVFVFDWCGVMSMGKMEFDLLLFIEIGGENSEWADVPAVYALVDIDDLVITVDVI